MSYTLSEQEREALLEKIRSLRKALPDLVTIMEILLASDRARHEELQRIEQELNRIRLPEESPPPLLSERIAQLVTEVSTLASEHEQAQEELLIFQASELYARSPRPWKQNPHQTHSTTPLAPSSQHTHGATTPELVRLRKIERIAKAIVYHFLQGQSPGYGKALKAMGKTLAQ